LHGHPDLLPGRWDVRMVHRYLDAFGFVVEIDVLPLLQGGGAPPDPRGLPHVVARTVLPRGRVSSVLLFTGYTEQLFETVVSGGPLDQRLWRHDTRAEAWAFHWCLVWQFLEGA
jgi:hypothetical protein